jgi:ketosteroid isomerase-like protein
MKSKFRVVVLLAITTLAFLACKDKAEQKKSFDLEKVRVEIQAKEDAFAAAEKAKDAKGVVAYYSEDAISYSRNEEPTVGRATIEAAIAKRMLKDSSGNYNVYKVVDLYGNEDMLVEIGSWAIMSPAGVEQDKGYYMSYFEKRDGKYVCVRDMNVTSLPPKPALAM